jgi:5-methylcytosine-specific restriction endonuclease McrA
MYRCRKCGKHKYGNYFRTDSLCRKCAAKQRRRDENVPVHLSSGNVVTRNVEKRLTKEAEAEIPISTAERLSQWAIGGQFVFFFVSGLFLQAALFDEWTGVRWLFILGWMMFIPMGVTLAVDKVLEKPRQERRHQIEAEVLVLAAKRQRDIEERMAFYSSPEWKLLRAQVIQEQGTTCSDCGRRITNVEDITVDHKRPRSKHPDLALSSDNLRVVCRQCNSRKGASDWREW